MAAAYALQSCRRADARHRYVLDVTSAAETKSVAEALAGAAYLARQDTAASWIDVRYPLGEHNTNRPWIG